MLSDSETESNDIKLTINEAYANAYQRKKEREELWKLEEKYGADADKNEDDDDSETDSEEDQSEDEDGEELTPAVDAAILRTLARIKRKDPDIYDNQKSIFHQEKERIGQTTLRSKRKAKNDSKPITIKQHALTSMLETTSRSPSPEPQIITHEQEQEALRSEAISAFHSAVDAKDDADGDDLLVPREKTKDEIEREEEEYQEFLRREVGEDIEGLVTVEKDDSDAPQDIKDGTAVEETEPKTKKDKKKSKKGKEQARQETDQEFLMNYILNRGWIDRSAKRHPTYNEITHDTGNEKVPDDEPQNVEVLLEEDDEFEDITAHFENSYNFRFEEPGSVVIPTYPRKIDSTVRRQDTTRKEARKRKKQRKEEEMVKKKEEIKRMKALKAKELREKLDEIGREGGIQLDDEVLANLDLDGDWDPEKHDQQMAGLYEGEEEEDTERPRWNDDIDIDDILPTQGESSEPKPKKKKKKKDDEAVDNGVDIDRMDADNPQPYEEEEWDGTEEMRKQKVQEYMDEVYGMDFNDMIGDTPTRFNYIPVASQSYALTPAELLLATDAELNEYMGLKKIAPYREDRRYDVKRAERLKAFKEKLKTRSWGGPGTTNADEEYKTSKKRKGKKERQRAKGTGDQRAPGSDIQEVESTSESPSKKRRKA